jgi:hypothetical protein
LDDTGGLDPAARVQRDDFEMSPDHFWGAINDDRVELRHADRTGGYLVRAIVQG